MNRKLNRAVNLLLLTLYILPITYLASGSFSLGRSAGPLTLLCVLLICLAAWISTNFRRGIFLAIPLAGLALYIVWNSSDAGIYVQLRDALDRVVGSYYELFHAGGRSYPYLGLTEDHSLVLCLMDFLLAFYISAGLTSSHGRVFFCLLGSVPPFGFVVAATETPAVWAVLCVLLFWAMLLAGGSRYEPDRSIGRSALMAALPALLILGIVFVPLGPGRYDRAAEEQKVRQINDELYDFLRDQYHKFFSQDSPLSLTRRGEPTPTPEPAVGSGDQLDLSTPFDFETADEAVLSVKADSYGFGYLRCVSYGDYTGTSWLNADDFSISSSLPYTAYAAQASGSTGHDMSVRVLEDDGFMYVPYFSPEAQNHDSFVSSDGMNEYTVRYFMLDDLSAAALPEAYLEEEAKYRDFAHNYYTRLPDNVKASMTAFLGANGLSASSPDIISQVADFVRSRVPYDLTVQGYPSEDYAMYFLTQAESGYCIHYATAATVMYRALGIPARVTEGYVYTSDPGNYTYVVRGDAHAWVELYYDGLGWVPVEVTSLFDNGDDLPAPTPEPTATPEPTVEPTEPPETPEPEESLTPEATPPAGEDPGPSPEQDGGGGAEGWSFELTAGMRRTLMWLAAAIALVLLVLLRRVLLLRLFDRRLSRGDRRKAAIALWKRAGKAAAYGAEAPEALKGLAEKAVFSRQGVSREELARGRSVLDEMLKNMYPGLSPIKKFTLKYIMCYI